MSNQIQRCYHLKMLIILKLLLAVAVYVETAEVAMTDRTDTMGYYKLANRVQCQRLCWYRQLCSAFSVNDRLLSQTNCVLHADPVQVAQLPRDWILRKAGSQGISGSCAARLCAKTDVCVPVISSTGSDQHTCLPITVDCGDPMIPNGTVQWEGTQQGDLAILTCDTGFEVTPAGSSSQLTCHVTSRWTPLDVTCSNIDECSPNPCQNGGVCSDGVNSYTCTCASGYIGINCQTKDIDECSPNPCQNGGVCSDGVNSYTCTCGSGYIGVNCQTKDPCLSSQHTAVNDPSQNVNSGGGNQCDSYSNGGRPGWYRLTLSGVNGVIPTYCPPQYRCGTVHPVWVDLQGNSMPAVGEQLVTRACGAVTGNCCTWDVPITIRHCPGGFMLYKVVVVPICRFRYCLESA